MTALTAIMVRDIRLSVRLGGGALTGVLFFLIVVTLMPFAIGPDLGLLARIGPAILWLGALLASLLALDRLIAADYEDGSLDLILMARTPLELALAAKALAHWLTTGLPLVIAAPLLGFLLNLDADRDRRGGADLARRHAGADLHRPDRRRVDGRAAARRAADRRAGVAADGSGADLRRRRVERRDRRAGAVRGSVHDSVRADADERGGRAVRRSSGAAAWTGMMLECAQCSYPYSRPHSA